MREVRAYGRVRERRESMRRSGRWEEEGIQPWVMVGREVDGRTSGSDGAPKLLGLDKKSEHEDGPASWM